MPQLDIFSFSSNIIWFLFVVYIMYIIMIRWIIPNIKMNKGLRRKKCKEEWKRVLINKGYLLRVEKIRGNKVKEMENIIKKMKNV